MHGLHFRWLRNAEFVLYFITVFGPHSIPFRYVPVKVELNLHCAIKHLQVDSSIYGYGRW